MAASLDVTADSLTIPFDGSTAIHASVSGLRESRDVPITVEAPDIGLSAVINIHVDGQTAGQINATKPDADPGALTGTNGEFVYTA